MSSNEHRRSAGCVARDKKICSCAPVGWSTTVPPPANSSIGRATNRSALEECVVALGHLLKTATIAGVRRIIFVAASVALRSTATRNAKRSIGANTAGIAQHGMSQRTAVLSLRRTG